MVYRTLAAASFIAAGLLLDGCGQRSAPKVAQAPTVSTAVAQTGTIYPTEVLPGLIAPFQNVAISSTLTEPTLRVNVQEGDRVRRGEVLAVLDTADLVAQMNSDIAQAKSDGAGATHTADQGQLTIQQSQQSVVNAQAAVAQARQTLAKDSLDLSRYQQLLVKGYIAEQQVAQQLALVRNDSAAVNSAAASLRSAQEQVVSNGTLQNPSGLQASSVEQAQALQQVALAQADQIRTSIVKATIYSPIDGVVVNRNLNVGEYPGTRQIFTLQQVNPIYAILHASGGQVADVAVGLPAKIVASDLGGSSHLTGRVAGVLNEVNPGSTDFQIKVILPNPDRKLRPGMAIEGNVALPPMTGIKIPATAFLDDNRDTIMIVGNDSAVKTMQVRYSGDDGRSAIVSGIAPGTRVISDGQTSVGDGEKVAVR
jgi:multidrug efflux pump subunit AcrA (membrane-fusion protein)